MNWGIPPRPYLSPQLPVEGISGRVVNIDPNLISRHNHQVDAEARSLAYTVGVYSSSQSTIRSVNEGAWTSYPENRIVGVHDDDIPTACFSDPGSVCQTMSPRITMSTLRVPEGFYSATVIPNEDQRHIDFADRDKSRSWDQECMPIDALLDHNHRYTHAHTTSDSSVSSTLSAGIYTTPTVAQHRDQRASRETPQGSKKSEEGPAAESPSPTLRSNWKGGAPPSRYRCTCGRDYAQPQGLTRHRRETHEACICMYCGAFAWARPYRFREHVKRKHPGVDPEVALEEATYLKTRRNVTIKTKHLPQCASPSAETRLYPSSSAPAAVGLPPVSLPAVASVGYDLHPGYYAEFAESTMEMRKYEDARDLSESLGANYAHIASPPSKQRARVEKTDPDMFAGRVWITARE
ncbi:hypothetical protein F5888DRAFT_1634853 [Russula emetica]|nr:hypothetical protein F5888DRAFT_1634853 [Russula emetica]